MKDRNHHWDPQVQQRQTAALAALPEDQRELMAFMIRTGNVSLHYYNEQGAEPDQEDFDDWLKGLDPVMANRFSREGFEHHRLSLPLRRHAAERKDLGLDQYMKKYLCEQDYNKWAQIQNGNH